MPSRSSFVAALAAVLLAAVAPVDAAPAILTFDEVRPGMRAVGRTVFSGTEIEEFQVEILGKLPDIGPNQDLILARCSGGPLATTGVMAGMSGSPVFHEGRLIGAIAYTWGFSKDAIAGITPIEEMLAVAARNEGSPASRADASPIDRDRLAPLADADRAAAFFDLRLSRLLMGSGAALPASIPLSVSGLGPHGLAAIAPQLQQAGLLPVQAGGRGSNEPSPPLEPGSAMGLKLVRGDVEMAATGTVTWVDGDGVLAFGHPLFGLGAIDLPLTGARVEALLPSLMQSSKIATPLGEVGALREDRASAVYGRLGAKPRMIPVRLRLGSAAGEDYSYAFDVADDPMLAPVLLYLSLNGILASTERTFGSATVMLSEGSVIKMAAGPDIELDNLYAGPTAFAYGTGITAYILHLVMNNTWAHPQIAGINLMLDYDDAPRTARIGRVTLDRQRVKPGELVTATVVLRPYRGPEQVFHRELRVPEDTPAGPLTLYVAGARTVNQTEETDEPVLPRDLDQLVLLINQLRRNDRIYLLAVREDNGVLLDGTRLPGLPPSATRVLSRRDNRENVVVVGHRGVFEDTIDTEYAVEGGVRLTVQVDPS